MDTSQYSSQYESKSWEDRPTLKFNKKTDTLFKVIASDITSIFYNKLFVESSRISQKTNNNITDIYRQITRDYLERLSEDKNEYIRILNSIFNLYKKYSSDDLIEFSKFIELFANCFIPVDLHSAINNNEKTSIISHIIRELIKKTSISVSKIENMVRIIDNRNRNNIMYFQDIILEDIILIRSNLYHDFTKQILGDTGDKHQIPTEVFEDLKRKFKMLSERCRELITENKKLQKIIDDNGIFEYENNNYNKPSNYLNKSKKSSTTYNKSSGYADSNKRSSYYDKSSIYSGRTSRTSRSGRSHKSRKSNKDAISLKSIKLPDIDEYKNDKKKKKNRTEDNVGSVVDDDDYSEESGEYSDEYSEESGEYSDDYSEESYDSDNSEEFSEESYYSDESEEEPEEEIKPAKKSAKKIVKKRTVTKRKKTVISSNNKKVTSDNKKVTNDNKVATEDNKVVTGDSNVPKDTNNTADNVDDPFDMKSFLSFDDDDTKSKSTFLESDSE